MKVISKFSVVSLLVLFFLNSLEAQVTIQSVDANSSKAIEIPVHVDKLAYTDFTFIISTKDSIAKIKDIVPFKNAELYTFDISNYYAIIKFKSKKIINIDSGKLFDIIIHTGLLH